MVCWVELSAQNYIYISNNPSHKMASRAEFLSALAYAEPLRPNAEAPGSNKPDRFVGDVGGIYTIPLSPQRLSSSSSTCTHNRGSFSLKAQCSQLPCSNICDSLRDLALESVRKLEKILLLRSCALGEALATWCVRYSWSLALRQLAVAR